MEKAAYTDLEVWKTSRELVNWIYSSTKLFPKEEMYGLTQQMRRCAVSIPSNIAEGCGRNHPKDSIQFFHIARGSVYELETQLYLSFDQDYLDNTALKADLEKIVQCKKLLNGFINYYQKLSTTNEKRATNNQ
jgi:four helix bundle protein